MARRGERDRLPAELVVRLVLFGLAQLLLAPVLLALIWRGHTWLGALGAVLAYLLPMALLAPEIQEALGALDPTRRDRPDDR